MELLRVEKWVTEVLIYQPKFVLIQTLIDK